MHVLSGTQRFPSSLFFLGIGQDLLSAHSTDSLCKGGNADGFHFECRPW